MSQGEYLNRNTVLQRKRVIKHGNTQKIQSSWLHWTNCRGEKMKEMEGDQELEVAEKLVEKEKSYIEDKLLGRAPDFNPVVGTKPGRRIFVGNLCPIPPITFEEYRSMIAPSGMKIEFLAKPKDIKNFKLKIVPSFDLYYKIHPTLKQQIDYVMDQDPDAEKHLTEGTPDKTVSLCPVFEKLTFDGSEVEVSLSSNEAIDLRNSWIEEIGALKNKAENDKRKYVTYGRTKEGVPWLEKGDEIPYSVINDEAFKDYISRRNGETRDPVWDFTVLIETRKTSESDDIFIVTISMGNLVENKGLTKHRESGLFNSNLKIFLEGSEIKPIKIDSLRDENDAPREVPARGINTSVSYSPEGNYLSTEHLPEVIHKRRMPRDEIDLHKDATLASKLAENPTQNLGYILEYMKESLEEYKVKSRTIEDEKWLDPLEKEVKRFEDGIEWLKKDNRAENAFKLMNVVMDESDDSRDEPFRWRIFQIIFIVMNIPTLLLEAKNKSIDEKWYDDDHGKKWVDVLHVPTGGGKTHCYLGLISFSVIWDRLRGKKFGVTAWLKFPLRMLSLQQLERVAQIITWTDYITTKNGVVGGSKGDRIRVGYFVGEGATPNRVRSQYRDQLGALDKIEQNDIDFKILNKCPLCDSDVEIIGDDKKVRAYHICTNKKCPGLEISSGRENYILPILVTDDEIYRLLPSLIISTLDKLSILNYNPRIRTLLGSKVWMCPDHGFSVGNTCIAMGVKGCRHNNNLTEIDDFDTSPSILIQDEMHLVREDLGTIASHYETIFDQIIEKIDSKNLKVITATATAKGASHQVHHLYCSKDTRIERGFPTDYPKGKGNIYYHSPKGVHRRIIGLMPHDRATKFAVYKTLQYYWEFIQIHITEPGLTNLSNELKCDKDILRNLLYNRYYTMLSYHLSRRSVEGFKESIKNEVNEILVRENLKPISPDDVTSERSMEDLRGLMTKIDGLNISQQEKIDLILATLMISHGVDFNNLNFMVFEGMPRSVSEYIQAMSRVARTYPGLIFMVFYANKERDQSYYRYYDLFHEYLYEAQEAVPINRWSKNAIEKTELTALLAVLHTYYSNKLNWGIKNVESLSRRITDGQITAIDLCKIINECLYTQPDPQGHFEQKVDTDIPRVITRIKQAGRSDLLFKVIQEAYPTRFTRGFRTVDRQVELFETRGTTRAFAQMNSPSTEEGEGESGEYGTEEN